MNRIAGILYGCVLGDAIGLGSEYMEKEEVAFYYPDLIEQLTSLLQQENQASSQSFIHYITFNQFIKDRHRSKSISFLFLSLSSVAAR